MQTYITLRLFEGLMGYYLKTSHPNGMTILQKLLGRKRYLIGWFEVYGLTTTKKKTDIKVCT